MKKQHATKSSGRGQGLVVETDTGRNVAVAYDFVETDLLVAAPTMLEALEHCVTDLTGATCLAHDKPDTAVRRLAEINRIATEAINIAKEA
jgi:hypothetical protein